MGENIHERYGPYPKKKDRKRKQAEESGFFRKKYEWIKWKITETGRFSIHQPCLDHS
ncbi:MAG: hypothetical protein ACUVWO_03430 [Thermodesulfobacteriota bacterium]